MTGKNGHETATSSLTQNNVQIKLQLFSFILQFKKIVFYTYDYYAKQFSSDCGTTAQNNFFISPNFPSPAVCLVQCCKID